MKKALYVIVIMILIIAFCVSAFLVARYVLEGKKQADRYEDLANIKNQAQTSVPTQATKPSTATEPSKPGFEVISDPTVEGGILLDYAELHDMNPDLAGWIKIEGTKVDYPVMQTSTNNKDYYLKRDFDKQDSVRGCIYAREECDLEKPSDNITIYGHNMANRTMFGGLQSYGETLKFDDNAVMYIYQPGRQLTYKFFACIPYDTSHILYYHDFKDEKVFNAFFEALGKAASNPKYKSDTNQNAF